MTDEPTTGELIRAIEGLRGDVKALKTDLDTRLDRVAAASVPAVAYVERNRATDQTIGELRVKIDAETTARKAAVEKVEAAVEKEKTDRVAAFRWWAAPIVIALGSSLVDLMTSGVG